MASKGKVEVYAVKKPVQNLLIAFCKKNFSRERETEGLTQKVACRNLHGKMELKEKFLMS